MKKVLLVDLVVDLMVLFEDQEVDLAVLLEDLMVRLFWDGFSDCTELQVCI